MNKDLENRLSKSTIYKCLKDKCEQEQEHAVLALVAEIAEFAVQRLKTVIKNMPEFTLHDDTHLLNMLSIAARIIPQEVVCELSIPDLLMLILSIFLHDIGMAPEKNTYLHGKTNYQIMIFSMN